MAKKAAPKDGPKQKVSAVKDKPKFIDVFDHATKTLVKMREGQYNTLKEHKLNRFGKEIYRYTLGTGKAEKVVPAVKSESQPSE